MATQWIPLTRWEPRSWLLSNGDIVKEPALEQTGTGRKVRVVGTTDSVYAGEVDALIGQAVTALAESKGASVLLDLTDWPAHERNALGYTPAEIKARLHLIHDPANQSGTTICWWRFKHPKMPFEAVLTARLSASPSAGSPGRQLTHVSITVPGRNYWGDTLTPNWMMNSDSTFGNTVALLRHMDNTPEYAWREFIRDNPPNWSSDLLGNRSFNQQRQGVIEFLSMVREFEGYDTIQVPDFSDPRNPAWMDLELYETNVNAELVTDLSEYLDSAPTIEQVAEMYETMLQTLRGIGITVKGKSANDFLAALIAGDKASLNMEVYSLSEQGHEVDEMHKVSVHLPTGTFIVECSHTHEDKNQVAAHWEEAKTVAALTGEESELLAYAREYARKKADTRTKAILKEAGL